jgi:RNA polymerase sigma factor (sigma-70 family)
MTERRRDWDLLRQFIDHNSHTAFAELTSRYLGLVYATAWREVGDRTLAEDVAQAVFLILARKARTFRSDVVLAAWLFDTCKFTARNALKIEKRRMLREREVAMEMSARAERPDRTAEQTTDFSLSDALSALPRPDRQAVLLRFVRGCTFAETGAECGVSEEAARKRVDRAIEKLRRILTRTGVGLSTAALADLLQIHTSQAASPALAGRIADAVLAPPGSPVLGEPVYTLVQGGLKSMSIIKWKIAAAVACGVVLTGGGTAAYQGIVHKATPAAAPVARDAARPSRVLVSVLCVEAPPASVERLSSQIPPGDSHDALLADDVLVKLGGRVSSMHVVSAGENEPVTVRTSSVVATGLDPNGHPDRDQTSYPADVTATPHIDDDRSLTVSVKLTFGQPVRGARTGAKLDPSTSRIIEAVGATPDGQMRLAHIQGSAASVGNTTPFVFVKAMTIANPGAAEFLIDGAARAMAKFMEGNGRMSSDDFLRYHVIEEIHAPAGALPDEDYDFLFALLKKPTREPWFIAQEVFNVLTVVPALPPDRKEQAYQAAMQYFSGPPTDLNILCRGIVAHGMAKLGDKRIIPSLVTLLDGRMSPDVRRQAAEDLKTFGYDVPATSPKFERG